MDEKNGMYGDHRFRVEKHPMYGTHPIPSNKGLRGVFKHSEESKKKSSETQKGKHNSPKTEFKTGHIFHEESRKKISQAHKDKHYSPKTEFKKGQIPVEQRKALHSKKRSPDWQIPSSCHTFFQYATKKIREKMQIYDELEDLQERSGAVNAVILIALGTLVWLISQFVLLLLLLLLCIP